MECSMQRGFTWLLSQNLQFMPNYTKKGYAGLGAKVQGKPLSPAHSKKGSFFGIVLYDHSRN
jgi:hypothetical protein